MSLIRAPKGKAAEDLKDIFAKVGITEYQLSYSQKDVATVQQPLTDEQRQDLTSEGYKIYEDTPLQTFKPA